MGNIYGLIDAEGELRYIGKANDPAARMKSHMREIKRRRTPLYDWLAKHGEPVMIVLEADCEDWRISERDWIAAGRLAGSTLLNLADGGDEPLCTREQRQANGRNNTKAHFTSEQASFYGRQLNERLKADPRLAKLRRHKASLGLAIKKGWMANRTRIKLRALATEFPDTFGNWKNIPDREENADGSPVGGYASLAR